MILNSEYKIEFLHNITFDLVLPLIVDARGCKIVMHELEKDRSHALASLEGPVDLHGLKTHRRYDPLYKKHLEARIVVPEAVEHHAIFKCFINIYSFVTDIPIRIVGIEDKKLIPESAEDKKCLKSMGTELLYNDLYSIGSMRTFMMPHISDEAMDELFNKEAGLALYAQAIKLSDSTLSFQELWKILESAFGQKGAQLVRSLSRYPPAIELRFTTRELEDLRTLRGRVSHADSKSGMKELNYVQRETTGKQPRLKCLVEQVLLTKKEWGTKSQEINRLAPLTGFIK